MMIFLDIYIGRVQLNGQKNLGEMLLGLSKLKKEWILNVYGSGELDEIRELGLKLGISKKIFFHGWVNDPWSSIKTADALLLTSNFEGFGMVLTEAISRGVPCVSSDCPVGPSDIIKSGVNGYLYESGNVDDFCSKLMKVEENSSLKNGVKISQSIKNFYDEKYDYRFLNALYYFSK